MKKTLAAMFIAMLASGCGRQNHPTDQKPPASPSSQIATVADSCNLRSYVDQAGGFSIGYLPSWGTPHEQMTGSDFVLSFGAHDSDYMAANSSVVFLIVESSVQGPNDPEQPSPMEAAESLSGNQDFKLYRISVGGRAAVEATFTQPVGTAVGSGIAHPPQQTKAYVIEKVFMPILDGVLTATHGHPKNEVAVCPFSSIVSTIKVLP